jgi:hypothetical protein
MVRRRGHRFADKDYAPFDQLGEGPIPTERDLLQGAAVTWRFVARILPAGMAFGCVLACAV